MAEALDLVRLGGYERRKPNQLSGGQQQRVALARALVNRPNVLLLDEPLGALDLKLRKQLQVELKRVQAEVGITFVYVTHDQEEALTMSDRIAVMNRGRVEQLGTPEELYERPRTRFVADFIGTTNLLDRFGRVDGAATLDRVRLESGEHCVVAGHAARRQATPVELSIRPESVVARQPPTGPQQDPRHWPPPIEQVAYLGRQRPVHRPHSWRTGPDRPCPEDRGAAARRWRRRRQLVAVRGPDPRHPSDRANRWRRPTHERPIRRFEHRPREGALPVHGRATDQPARPPRADGQGRFGGRARAGDRRLYERCGAQQATGTPAPAGATPAAASAAPRRRRPAAPTPEGELFIYNWTDYLADEVIESFEAKYGTRVTQSFFSNTEEAYAKLGDDGGGYDLSFPISVDVPSFIEKGAIVELDRTPRAEHRQPRRGVVRSGLRPGQHATPCPTCGGRRASATTRRMITEELTSSKALWDPRCAQHISMLDDFQEVFGLALIQLGYSANTPLTNELDEALALLKEQKPLVRTYSTDTIATMTSGDVWIGHIWGADRYAIQEVNENVLYYIPEEGGVKGSDTVAVFSGAPHPIAAHLFINHLLDAQNSAANTNLIYYMGPNAAAKEFILPEILDDPTINPDQQIVDKLEELLNLDGALRDEYLKPLAGAAGVGRPRGSSGR